MDTADGRPDKVKTSESVFHHDIKAKFKSLVHKIQAEICEEIQKFEEVKTFTVNKWTKSKKSKGITRILEDGDVFEKVGVSVSNVAGNNLPSSAYLLLSKRTDSPDIPTNASFFCSGINGVVYPKNPHIPILNFNYRYFEMSDGKDFIWWFGGGSDLTPCLLHKNDCQHFHRTLKQCCDKYNDYYYKGFKKNCDDHFYLEHRGERRGIGGIYFNELSYPDQDSCFQFVSACLQNILPSYMPIVVKNLEEKYSSSDKERQLIQRGRYAEFYLVSDKATKLVMMTPGIEIESLLTCLPPSAKWHYNNLPEENSSEYELTNILRNPVDWV